MTLRPTVKGMEGETGGLWRQAKHDCTDCQAILVHDVVDKIGDLESANANHPSIRASPLGWPVRNPTSSGRRRIRSRSNIARY